LNNTYLDKKLEELQEGPILISFAILAALLAGGAFIQSYKIDKFLKKHKEKIEALLEQAKKNNILKISIVGNRLSKIILTKYSFIYPKYYYDKTIVKKWQSKEYYEEEVPKYFRGFTRKFIQFKGKKVYDDFFYLYINSDSTTDAMNEEEANRIFEEDRSLSKTVYQANKKVTQIISQDINRIITFLKPLLIKENK